VAWSRGHTDMAREIHVCEHEYDIPTVGLFVCDEDDKDPDNLYYYGGQHFCNRHYPPNMVARLRITSREDRGAKK